MQKYHEPDLGQYSFLVSGGAGFIGSNIVEYLLEHGAKKVRVLDDLSTGSQENVDEFLSQSNYEFVKGDIRDLETCRKAVKGVDYVLHQAALGSVPRSIEDPLTTHEVNLTGFLNMLIAARDEGVKRFIYASSSSVYGDDAELEKLEGRTGVALSPYAVTKVSNELYGDVFAELFDMSVVGLRYFNVFGKRQSPEGAYAAVIPRFMHALSSGGKVQIISDGEQTRDFTHVDNAVQANICALFSEKIVAAHQVFNIAVGETNTVKTLFEHLCELFNASVEPEYIPERPGEIRDSLADISKAREQLGYDPRVKFREGLEKTADWFQKKHGT